MSMQDFGSERPTYDAPGMVQRAKQGGRSQPRQLRARPSTPKGGSQVSKDNRKRAYVAPQADAKRVKMFEAAWAKHQAAFHAFENCHYDEKGNIPDDVATAWHEAADAVFGVPAPNGEALSRAIALFAYPNHIDGWLTDPKVRAEIAADGDEEEKKLLTLYLNAAALSGISAEVAPNLTFFAPSADFAAALERIERLQETEQALGKIHTAAEEREIAERTPEAEAAVEAAYAPWSTAHEAVLRAVDVAMEIPTRHPSDVQAKYALIKRHGDDHEDEVRWLRSMLAAGSYGPTPIQAAPAPATGCAVSDLIPALRNLLAQEQNAGERRDVEAETRHFDARDALSNKIADMRAGSVVGAALQLALAMERAELIRGCYTQEDRDYHHVRFEALMRSALGVLGGSLPDDLWLAYVGGDRPAPAPPPSDDATMFLAWEAEAQRLLSEFEQSGGEEDHDQVFQCAMKLHSKILTTPGRGKVVAQVKLRTLAHPEVGIANGEGANDIEALRTALDALS